MASRSTRQACENFRIALGTILPTSAKHGRSPIAPTFIRSGCSTRMLALRDTTKRLHKVSARRRPRRSPPSTRRSTNSWSRKRGQMPATLTAAEISTTRQQLRTFHIAGRGLEQLTPAGPLWPALLDQLPPHSPAQTVDLSSLYARTLSSSRAKARADFLEKVKKLRERLRELFSPESAASFGREAGTFLDARALSEAFQTRAGGTHM